MEQIYKNLGEKMREARIKTGLTQAQVAEKASIEPAYYGQLERATKVPSLQTLMKIARILKTSPSALMQEAPDSDFDKNIRKAMIGLSASNKKFAANLLRDAIKYLKKGKTL